MRLRNGSLSLVLMTAILLEVSGCASFVAKVFPFGEPVTRERCLAIDTYQMGFKDGADGQRSGEKLDFWRGDCRPFGVRLDEGKYAKGYDDGMAAYCSCEKGFSSGVRDEFAEMRGQYFMCSRAAYSRFLKGHAAGLEFKDDASLVQHPTAVKTEFVDAAITAKAQQICPTLLASVEAAKKKVWAEVQIDSERRAGRHRIFVRVTFFNGTGVVQSLPRSWIGDRRQLPASWLQILIRQEKGAETLAFTGVHQEESRSLEDSFVTLAPNAQLTSEFDISEAFPWRSGQTRYSVQWDAKFEKSGVAIEVMSDEVAFTL